MGKIKMTIQMSFVPKTTFLVVVLRGNRNIWSLQHRYYSNALDALTRLGLQCGMEIISTC